MPPVLAVVDLWKSYAVGVRGCSVRVAVLRGVTFHVERGERVGIVGAPGAGKTTLLHCVAGLRQPDRGTVVVSSPADVGIELLDEGMLERPLRRRAPPSATLVFSRDIGRLRARTDRILVLLDGRIAPAGPRDGARVGVPGTALGEEGVARSRGDSRVAVRRVAEPVGVPHVDAGALR